MARRKLSVLRLQLVVLVIVLIPADGVQFISNPPKSITAVKGFGVWLQWQYNTFGSNLHSFACYHEAKGTRRKLVEEKNKLLTAVGPIKEKISVFETNRTFSIWNLQYNDTGVYFCELRFEITVPFVGTRISPVVPSQRTTLTIEGPPEFCSPLPKPNRVVKEGATMSFPFTFCGFPAIELHHRWLPNGEVRKLATKPEKTNQFRHRVTLTVTAIKRAMCGRTLNIFGINKRGRTPNSDVNFRVMFTPRPPPAVKIKRESNSSCLIVSWDKQAKGGCAIDYVVDFIDQKNVVLEKMQTRKFEVTSCKRSIRVVRLTASTQDGSVSLTRNAETPGKPKPSESASKVAIYSGAGVGVFVLLGILLFFIFYSRKKRNSSQKKNGDENSGFEEDEKYESIDDNFLEQTNKKIEALASNEKISIPNKYEISVPPRPRSIPSDLPIPKLDETTNEKSQGEPISPIYLKSQEEPTSPVYLKSQEDYYLDLLGEPEKKPIDDGDVYEVNYTPETQRRQNSKANGKPSPVLGRYQSVPAISKSENKGPRVQRHSVPAKTNAEKKLTESSGNDLMKPHEPDYLVVIK